MFALEVTLLTGRYIATAFDDRGRAEWPPHPARLFSALVATHFESLDPREDERAALAWMEDLGAPEITASEAGERDVVTVFVPVNDAGVVSSVDDEARAVDDARLAVEVARGRGAKELAGAERRLAKAQNRLAEAISRAIAAVPSGKEGKDGPARAASLLPEHRLRQPRTFPSVTPIDSRVIFAWPHADASPELRSAIDDLAARVVRLGHSSSLVTVRVCDESREPTWIPNDTGGARGGAGETVLRVATRGQVAALQASFATQADDPGRVMPAAFQRYVRPAGWSDECTAATAFSHDWIVLRRVGGPRLPSIRAVDVARMVRKTLLKMYADPAPEILSGHRPSGEPSERAHLAIVPLPFVGHERGDGSILGVALVLPRAATDDERRAVLRALEGWRRAERESDEEQPRLPVHLGRAGTLLLVALEQEAEQSTLLADTWCARATTWASATPVALDRNPGDLRSSDPRKRAAAFANAEETIALACERIGLPRPRRVTATPAAPLAGGAKARHFPPFQAGKPPIQRVLVHARLQFERPVAGPVLLGAGRYFGLGLFRPVRDHG